MRNKIAAFVLFLSLLLGGTVRADTPTFQGLPVVNLKVNGRPVQGKTPAVLLAGSTMVPLRSVADAMGAAIGWDPESFTAVVDTAPITAPLEAQLAAAGQDLALKNQQLLSAVQALAEARSELERTRKALENKLGGGTPAPQELTPQAYMQAILATPMRGPHGNAARGWSQDCSPQCMVSPTVQVWAFVHGHAYLTYGLEDTLPVEVLAAPCTLVTLRLERSGPDQVSLGLADATLAVDDGKPVKSVYRTQDSVVLKPWQPEVVHMVFPVAPGSKSQLTLAAKEKQLNLTAYTPRVPENLAEYAKGPPANPAELAPLETAFTKQYVSWLEAPTGGRAPRFPVALTAYYYPAEPPLLAKWLGEKSPAASGRYWMARFLFLNPTTSTVALPPSAFAVPDPKTGAWAEPIGFLSEAIHPLAETYNGHFAYPNHWISVIAVYRR